MKDLLLKLRACEEAIKWAGDKTAKEIIATCYRGDWLLWLANRLKVDDRSFTLAKGHCANTVRHLMQDERSIKAVDAAIAYGNGEISKVELKAAASAYAAAYAATYATYAAYSAAASAYAASDAACASAAAYSADGACASATEKALNQIETADICRKYLGHLILEKLC